jgi:spore coat polysaccharide biosynthesis protein SpsF (cytidylyltransferase family)/MoaA/NifB/PqqE/SkfB family radical SAM enzyme
MRKEITAIIQSSWRSEIVKYKSLVKLINGQTVLEHIVNLLDKVNSIDRIVLATTDDRQDSLIINEAKRLNINCYVGSVNVLERLDDICKSLTGYILKIDGNKPLLDIKEAEKLLQEHINGGFDYSYNGHYNGVIYGTDCEVFSTDIFRKIRFDKLTPERLEDGTLYIRTNPENFKINQKKYFNPHPNYRLIFEYFDDLEVINHVIKNVKEITNEHISSYLDENPIIATFNRLKKESEVGYNKVFLFPDKIKALQSYDMSSLDYSYPISVELSLTNRCNYSCIWCSDKDLRKRQKDDMGLDTLTKLAKDLNKNGTKGITIEGGGEPTVYRKFREAVQIFKEQKLSVGLITNGSMIMDKKLLNMFDWIRVSLDVSCNEEMKKLKKISGYEKVISNIIYYANNVPVVGVGYVATKDNLSHIESLILRLRETKVNYIQFRLVIDHPELLPEYDFEYLKKYQTDKFTVITDGIRENTIRANNGISCKAHSLTTVISADGSVFLCGRLNIYDWIKPIGNINSDSFFNIWNGFERKKQSTMVEDVGFCKKYCPECRLTKYNILFNNLKELKTRNFI